MSREKFARFRLYVAGDGENSQKAIDNLNSMCKQHLPGQHEIEIVDVRREPKRALLEGIIMTPTLLKLAPNPIRRIVGSLSDAKSALAALGLEAFIAKNLPLPPAAT